MAVSSKRSDHHWAGGKFLVDGYGYIAGGGELGALMRSHDWSETVLGSVEQWPQSLRSALSICLNSRFPIAIYWGSDNLLLYNDAWRPIVGDKHPWALGRPAREVWAEIWEDIGPELASVLATGEGIFHSDELLAMHRFGYTEECFFDYTFNPIQGEGGGVDGVLNIVTETTYRVLNDRRTRLLREVAFRSGTARTVEEAATSVIETLRTAPVDIPFALLYLLHPHGRSLYRAGSTEVALSPAIAPDVIDLTRNDVEGWTIATVARTGEYQMIENLVETFGTLPGSPWAEPPQEAMVLPLASQGRTIGVLVAVASPRRRLDENYCDFFDQIANQAAVAIANARSYEEERRRAEQLAELDRAKTVFFSNVSHEFRTPLTLMLGPVEDALQDTHDREQRDRLELIHRNALRLQKLVNTLLDFSRIEANRIEATYRPTDLALLTRDLAGTFQSAIERADLVLRVDCPSLPEPIYVDREMWEKIVLNLLSNAFKFTFAGEISVNLRFCDDHVELTIADTGIGIPAEELPHIFERFHRVQGARGRTYEGSGIGLSLVQELVLLHGGDISVESVVDQGTRFTIAIPTGWSHLPGDRVHHSPPTSPPPGKATQIGPSSLLREEVLPYVTEVLRWVPASESEPSRETVEQKQTEANEDTCSPSFSTRPRVILADDNADMRDYVARLLSTQYDVEAVGDGTAALAAIRRQPPDLVLTDIMMPEVDGFELLQALRADPTTQDLPIILLSARAGEESRIEGLEAGADDYLIKPFSARELLARVEAILKLAQMRQEVARYEQKLRVEAEASEERVSLILESITDAFVALDHHWRYTYVNEQAATLLHKTRDELIGKHVWEEVFPSRVGTLSYRELHRAVDDQISVVYEDFSPLLNVWFEAHAYPSRDGLAIYFQDISDRKRAELMLIEQTRLLEFIASGRPLEECLSAICTSVSTLNPRVRACLLITDTQGYRFSRSITPDFPPPLAERLKNSPIHELWPGFYEDDFGLPIICADVAHDERWSHEWRELCVGQGILACHITPVLDPEHQPLGALMLTFDEARLPTDWEYQLSDFGLQVASIAFERDRSTLALLESEHRYRLLFESIDEGFCICEALFDEDHNPIDHRFLKVNPAFEKLTGMTDVAGKTIRELVPNLESFWIDICGEVVLTGESIRFERESIVMNRWFDINAFPMGGSQSSRIAILFTNITERKQSERERERFLSVGSDLQVISSTEGYFQWVSPTFERVLGWTREEMTTRPWIKFVHPDDVDRSISEDAILFSSNQTIAFENRYRCKDGSYRWFLWNAQAYAEEQITYAVAVDITERKEIEETLQQREAELSLVTNAVPVLISFVDADQRYRFNNHRYEEWFGQAATELQGKHLKEILGPEAYEEIRPYVEQVLAGHPVTYERLLPYRNGEARYVSATYVPRFAPHGDVEGFVALVHDISDRKQAEQEREQLLVRERVARETAEAANRVKDEFLAVLSHELRSPLNPILGWSRLLQRGNLDATKTQQALATIERNARLQSELIEDLLDVSRILQGKLSLAVSPVQLSPIIRAAIETVRLAAEAKSIQIETHLDLEVGLVSGDPTRLQQVVWNLLSNGVKFTASGGRVDVRLTQVDRHAQIIVSDTGKGIAPDFLPYVFEYFRQEDGATTRKFGGLGLGLAIVRHLVELHGGTVHVDSPGEGLGSTFTVLLPLMPSGSPVSTHHPLTNQVMNLDNVRVLVVDDDVDTRDLVVFLLEQAGATVTAAASAHEALSTLPQVQPDVLISDIGMPGTDGYMLIQHIRALPPEQGGRVPAIALTAYAGDFNQQRSLQAGFQQHLAKPIEPDQLLEVVADLVNTGTQAKT